MRIYRLRVRDIEYIAYRLAKETMTWSEPIPDFSTRYTNSLERSLQQPYQTFSGRQLYKTFLDKAAILFYLMIKNHPFQNGNKRIAIATLFFFLHKHNKWLKIDNQELYNFAKFVASSNPKLKEDMVKTVKTFLKLYISELK